MIILLNYKLLKFNNDLLINLKNIIFNYFINLSFLPFKKIPISSKTRDIHNLTSQFVSVFALLMKTFNEILIAIMIIIFLLIFVDYKLITIIIFLFFVLFLYLFFFSKHLSKIGKQINSIRKDLYQITNESMEGYIEIKVFNLEKFFLNIFNSKNINLAKNNILFGTISLIPRALLELSMICIIFFIVVYFSDYNNNIIILYLSIFASASLKLIPSFNLIMNFSSHLYGQRDTINKLSELLNENVIAINNKNSKSTNKEIKKLFLDKINFTYDKNSKFLIKDLSLEASIGDIIAIIGRSGSGKSTLINIITGLIKPISGKIIYNSKQLLDENSNLLNFISYIPQNPFIFEGSVKENIVLGAKFNKKKYEFILSILNLNNELYQNIIDTDGTNLSGGQKQRIAIARSYYADKQIMILDETTNSLDNKNKSIILKSVKALSKNKIIFLVTHDKDVIKVCNKTYDIKKKALKTK